MQPLAIVDLLNEPGQAFGHIREGFLAGRIDVFHFQGLHKALCLRIMVRVTDGVHGTLQAGGIERSSIGLTCVSASAVRVVDAAGWRLSVLKRRTQCGQRQRRIQAF